jgi:hypothetical protein
MTVPPMAAAAQATGYAIQTLGIAASCASGTLT